MPPLALAARRRAGESRETARSRAQFQLVHDLTSQSAQLVEPDALEMALLCGCARVLAADALFLDRAGCCRRIELTPAGPAWSTDTVRGALAGSIEAARRQGSTHAALLTPTHHPHLGGAQVLLGTLARPDAGAAVLVALRTRQAPAFDAGDLAAAQALLSFGTNLLSNAILLRDLQRNALETVCTLVNAIDAKDNYTSDHSERVGGLARLTGEALGLPRARLQALEWAGLLHDVGKIGIPEEILNKPGPLSANEFEAMKRHALIGHDVLKPVAQLRPVLTTVLHHHENFDGSGYPAGLAGEQIPLEARIIHVVDVFDALTTDRPYRPGYGIDAALSALETGAGQTTDPTVTNTFITALKSYMTRETAAFRLRFGHLLSRAGGGEPAGAGLPGGGLSREA